MAELKKKIKSLFNSEGNFKRAFDPYRDHESETKELLFENNALKEAVEKVLLELIKEKEYGPFSDAVRLYYSQEHGKKTDGAYPAVYMWK